MSRLGDNAMTQRWRYFLVGCLNVKTHDSFYDLPMSMTCLQRMSRVSALSAATSSGEFNGRPFFTIFLSIGLWKI